MKDNLFDLMISEFEEAIKHRRGQKSRVRVSRLHLSKPPRELKPEEIRKIRKTLNLSQLDFANYLGTSVGSVRSWEQGVRKPQKTALRLLTIAKKRPALLLEKAS